jgi:hypothetical protein
MREHFVVLSIGSRDVACTEWSNIWRFEHFLDLLDFVNDAFNVHSVSISNTSVVIVKRSDFAKNPKTAPAAERSQELVNLVQSRN